MKLPLTGQQAEALKHLFEKVINPELPGDVAESLLKDIMFLVYKKLRTKIEGKKKDGYSLTLNDIEGKAFYLYFQNRCLGDQWRYEQNMIDAHLMELDKVYA